MPGVDKLAQAVRTSVLPTYRIRVIGFRILGLGFGNPHTDGRILVILLIMSYVGPFPTEYLHPGQGKAFLTAFGLKVPI